MAILVLDHVSVMLSGKSLSKRAHVYLFLVAFFLCSCFLSWVDKDDALKVSQTAVQAQQEKDNKAYTGLKNEFDGLIAQCSYQAGVVDTLGRQNRDQQNSINNCQNQALHLLVPPNLQIDAFLLGDIKMKGDQADAQFIVITNKPISPTRLKIMCTRPILGAQALPVEQGTTIGSFGKEPKGNTVEVGFDAPAWTPRSPIKVDVNHSGALGASCTFVPE